MEKTEAVKRYNELAEKRIVPMLLPNGATENTPTSQLLHNLERASDRLEGALKRRTDSQVTQHGRRAVMEKDNMARLLADKLDQVNSLMFELAEGVLCEKCGYGLALHSSNGDCPEDPDPLACPYCGSLGAFEGWELTGPDSPDTWNEHYTCLGDCGREYTVTRHNDDYNDFFEDPAIFDTSDLTDMEFGRFNKCLAREYNFAGEGVMRLDEWLKSRQLTRKSKRVRKYARRKRQGVHKELKTPKTEYTVWTGETGIEIPKLVWDCLTIEEKGA